MKTTGRILIITIMVLGYSCTTSRPYSYPQPQQGSNISMQVFYDELSPHGYWVHNREYGYVWIPHAGSNFFPYASHGRWAMTQYGWTWISDFDWGWAPFHYGRWDFDPNYGWFWFPGTEWAPAWVTWRSGNGYYGWAPLGPGARTGMGMYPGTAYGNDPSRWVFVRERDFGRPNITRYAVNQRRNNEILKNSRLIDNTRRDDNRRVVYNPGPDPSEIRQSTGRQIRQLEVRDSNMPGKRIRNNTLEIYRPRVEMRAEGNRPAPAVINDVKDIKPMRERERDYRPQNQQELEEMRTRPETGGQGSRSTDREQEQLRREREVERQNREKLEMRQRRQKELDTEQQEKELENRSSRSEREYRQNAQERQQKTGQQRKIMQKERRIREEEVTDTSRTRRIQQETTRQRR
jgi:hypothetical protein